MDSFDEAARKNVNMESAAPCPGACEVVDTGDARVCCFPAAPGPVAHEAGLVRFPMPHFSLRL